MYASWGSGEDPGEWDPVERVSEIIELCLFFFFFFFLFFFSFSFFFFFFLFLFSFDWLIVAIETSTSYSSETLPLPSPRCFAMSSTLPPEQWPPLGVAPRGWG